jgi:NAD-dependent SIR2 family protein deacetylase
MTKEEMIEYYAKIDAKRWEICKALEKLNEKKQAEIEAKGELVNSYTCQKCKREFVTDQELKIIPDQEPLCPFCKCNVTPYTYLNKDIPTDIS